MFFSKKKYCPDDVHVCVASQYIEDPPCCFPCQFCEKRCQKLYTTERKDRYSRDTNVHHITRFQFIVERKEKNFFPERSSSSYFKIRCKKGRLKTKIHINHIWCTKVATLIIHEMLGSRESFFLQLLCHSTQRNEKTMHGKIGNKKRTCFLALSHAA